MKILILNLLIGILLWGCNATLQDPVFESRNIILQGTPPSMYVESLRTAEYLKGGSTYKIKLTITDRELDSNTAKIEYSRDGGVTWSIATSSTGQDGERFPTAKGELSEFNWFVPREASCSVTNPTSDSTNYRIRITAYGRPDAAPVIYSPSTNFTVDSCAPVISGSDFSISQPNLATGFMGVTIPTTEDAHFTSPLKDVCIKLNSQGGDSSPSDTDSCWLSLNSLGQSSSATSITSNQIPYFYSYKALTVSDTAYLWVRDMALNSTALTSTASGAGTMGVDLTPSFKRSCVASSCVFSTVTGTTLSASLTTVGLSSAVSKTDITQGSNGDNGVQTVANQEVLDPQYFVVNSSGLIYLRDRALGIVKVNPQSGTITTLIPIGATAVDGPLTTARVVEPVRIALDSFENLIIYDKDRIRRLNLTAHSADQSLETLIGGGNDTSSTVKVATNLQIDYHPNVRWYGTFQVLPNNWIVFNSENPNKSSVSGTSLFEDANRFRLRVYQPEKENKINSIKLSGQGLTSDTAFDIANAWPYSSLAVKYNSTNRDISQIHGRFCEAQTTCALQGMAAFDKNGVTMPSAYLVGQPNDFGNDYLFYSKSGQLYSANRTSGTLKRYDFNNSNWTLLLGKISALEKPSTLCSNVTATNCDVDLWDVFIGPNETIYFIDQGTIRFIDKVDGRVKDLVKFTP